MSVQYKTVVIALTNGPKDKISLPQAFTSTRVSIEYFSDEGLQTPAAPSSGTVLFESSDASSGDVGWTKMRNGRIRAPEIDAYPRPFTDKPAYWVRVTPEDVVGANYARLTVWQDAAAAADPIEPEVYEGTKALITQPYTEANIKRGLQYYFRASWPLADSIPAGASRYLRFDIGAKPLIVKLREMHYVAEEIELTIYTGPTTTGGTPITPTNWNQRLASAPASTLTITKSPSVSTEGTPLDEEPEYFFGGGAAGQRDSNSIPQGRERLLAENTSYLLEFRNSGTGSARLEYFLDWFEGEPDLPLL